MPTFRLLSATIMAAALGAVFLPPATAAVPERATAQPASKRVCSAIVSGVDPQRRMHNVEVVNGRVRNNRVSAPLSFVVRQQGLYGVDVNSTGTTVYTRATTAGGRSRLLAISQTKADTHHLTVTATAFDPRQRFAPGLFTASYGVQNYAVAAGRLVRLTTFWDRNSGKLFFGAPKVIRAHLDLKTLAYANRVKLKGAKVDVLYATTTRGALMTIHVPVATPRTATFRVIKRSGLARYTGLSLASCDAHGSVLALVAIDAKAGYARWFFVGDGIHPKASQVRQLMRVRGANWHLRAVI